MAETSSQKPTLEVKNLQVDFPGRRGTLTALSDVSLSIMPGEILGVVGESGAGKSMTGLAVQGLLESPGHIAGGEVLLNGRRIDNLSDKEMQKIRGREIGAIFQDPLTSLNPLFTIGSQLVETITQHLPLSRTQAQERAISLLKEVGIPAPEDRINHYPHQFSGGMRQRVVIALALAAEPKLIIADEPTTALDVSIQAQITSLLRRLCKEHGTAVMLVTHDMGVIAETADRVAVMYAGRLVENGPVETVLKNPSHMYTRGLMSSIPALGKRVERLNQIDGSMPRLDAIPTGCAFNPRCVKAFDRCRSERPDLMPAADGTGVSACWLNAGAACMSDIAMKQSPAALEVKDLSICFDVSAPWLNRVIERKPRQMLHAVNDISFSVPQGGCLSLVGESGCGKSTVARLVTGLYRPSNGEIRFAPSKSGAPLSAHMIFQDPYASLNPRWRVHSIIAEPLRELKLRKTEAEINDRVEELLKIVGLAPSDGKKFPHEFSGGQRQRISIARALAGEPEFLVCDEPTSALDVSVQAQILNLMRRLQDELGLTFLFISHDMSVVRHMSDRIAVMYLGRIVEEADTETLFADPKHPYTRLLLETIPNIAEPHRDRVVGGGEVPSPLKPPSGCTFHPRCAFADSRCSATKPEMKAYDDGSRVACHRIGEI